MNPIMMAAFVDELAYINGFEKDAGLGSMVAGAAKGVGKLFKPKALKSSGFTPSFKGHGKTIQQAVSKGTGTNARGVTQTAKWNPMTQNVKRQKFVTGVEGWN